MRALRCRCRHWQVLVLETCGGLVMGAVAERLGGFGTACSVYTGRSPPSQDAVRMFNFPWAMRDSLCCASLERLAAAASGDSHSTLRQGAARTVAAPSTASDDARTARTLPPQIGPAVAAADLEAMRNPAVGVSGDPNQAAASANGVHHAPEVIGNGMPVVASAASSRQTANSADILPSGADGAADPGMDVFPPSNDDVAQQPEPVASVSAQNNGVSEAGRFPRNAEPKRCITTVPPASDEQLRALLRPGFSSCVIAAPTLQPIAAVQRLLPFLAPSAFLVVFSPFLQPLAEAMAALQASKAAINLQLQVCHADGLVMSCFVCMAKHTLWIASRHPAVYRRVTSLTTAQHAGELVARIPGAPVPHTPGNGDHGYRRLPALRDQAARAASRHKSNDWAVRGCWWGGSGEAACQLSRHGAYSGSSGC